ncbi:MAG: CCDC90 family protein [Desulfobacterales bacterium]|nr:CCDC90 family protein [Desulfobacterales bacterium]
MPSVMTFDTLAYAKKLKAAGVPDEQAEVQAEALKDIVNTELMSKRDLTEAKIEIIKWVAGMLVAQAAIVATLVKLL